MTIYLYRKTHNQTGLKYLGKTKYDPHRYKGSGIIWVPHIKKYGYDVTTEILKECQTDEELKYWGLYYSTLWNIVEEKDEKGKKTWANLKPESGDGGDPGPEANKNTSARQKGRIPWNKGVSMWSEKQRKEIGVRNSQREPQSAETIQKRVCKTTGKKRTEEQKVKMSQSQKGKVLSERHKNLLRGSRPHITAHNRDLISYNFIHITGIEEYCSRHELCKKYTLNGSNISNMINGKRKSHKGWSIRA